MLWMCGCGSEALMNPAGWSAALLDPFLVEAQTASGEGVLTADAGPDLIVASGAVTVLRGQATHTGAGVGNIEYCWSQISGPGAKGATVQRVVVGQKLVFTAPTGPAVLVFGFRAEDASGVVAEDTCEVEVLGPGSGPPGPPPATVVLSGNAGWLEGGGTPYLEEFGVDFLGEGVTSATDVLEVISGTGVLPGVYGITSVTSLEVYLDSYAGQSSTADVVYRVLRP